MVYSGTMIPFIPVLLKLIEAAVQGGQLKKEEAAQAQASLLALQQTRSQTFATFIQNTSSIIYTIMRNAIVGIFAAALVVPGWGRLVAANAAAMPPYFWIVIFWEFYGNDALYALPWFKNSQAVGPTQFVLPTYTAPSDPQPITSHPSQAPGVSAGSDGAVEVSHGQG